MGLSVGKLSTGMALDGIDLIDEDSGRTSWHEKRRGEQTRIYYYVSSPAFSIISINYHLF